MIRLRVIRLRMLLMRALPIWLLTRALLIAITIAIGADIGRWRFWDGAFYLSIALHGYRSWLRTNWFPFYPGLLRLLGANLITALVASNLLLLAALMALFALGDDEGIDAAPGVRLLLLSPFAFFFAAPYTESLFLLLAVLALRFARKRQWLAAALCCAIAGATRPVGLLLLLPLLAEWWTGHKDWRGALYAGVSASGFGAFSLYCAIAWQDPLAMFHAQAVGNGHAFRWPWQTIGLMLEQMRAANASLFLRQCADVLPLLVCLVALTSRARTQRLSWTIYSLAMLLPILLSPTVRSITPDALTGAARYTLIVFPVWIALGRWLHIKRAVEVGALIACAALQIVAVRFVLTGGWLV